MLRRQSRSSTILPSNGMDSSSSSQSSSYLGYGRSYSGASYSSSGDPYASRSSFGSSTYDLGSKRRSSYSSKEILPSFVKNSTSWLALGLAVFILATGYYQSQFQWVTRELHVDSLEQVVQTYHELYNEKISRKRSSSEMNERYSIMERLNSKLHKEKEELRTNYEKKMMKEFATRREEEDRLIAREEAFKSQIKVLQNAASREAQRSVEDKFGRGHHFVEFTFILPSDVNETEHHFIVETAPLELMPHAVQLFLEQVQHKLWDNSWFYINGPHVLQAGPMLEEDESVEEDTFEADRKAALKPFVDAGLASLSYPEYSHQYRHEKWTLGFTGRPGGPDWYINKQNNTVMHGPGGQYHHDIEEQADPCFARVVEGFDMVEKMFEESTIEEGDDWEYFFWDPIYIVKAVILNESHLIEETYVKPEPSPDSHHPKHHADFHKFPKVEHDQA